MMSSCGNIAVLQSKMRFVRIASNICADEDKRDLYIDVRSSAGHAYDKRYYLEAKKIVE